MTVRELKEFVNKIPEEYNDYTLVSGISDDEKTSHVIVTDLDEYVFSYRSTNKKYCCVNMYTDRFNDT